MINTKITSITLLAITLTIAITIPQADASPTPTDMTLTPFDKSDGTQKIWYNLPRLSEVTLDGASNSVGMRLIGEVSRAAIDTTDMNVSESTSYSHGSDSRVDARFYSSTNYFGELSPYGTGTSMYKVIWFNNNDNLDYKTSNACTTPWNAPNPEYIMNHEFGHFAGLKHHGAWPFNDTHTAMKSGCNPGQAQIRADDKTDINSWYD